MSIAAFRTSGPWLWFCLKCWPGMPYFTADTSARAGSENPPLRQRRSREPHASLPPRICGTFSLAAARPRIFARPLPQRLGLRTRPRRMVCAGGKAALLAQDPDATRPAPSPRRKRTPNGAVPHMGRFSNSDQQPMQAAGYRLASGKSGKKPCCWPRLFLGLIVTQHASGIKQARRPASRTGGHRCAPVLIHPPLPSSRSNPLRPPTTPPPRPRRAPSPIIVSQPTASPTGKSAQNRYPPPLWRSLRTIRLCAAIRKSSMATFGSAARAMQRAHRRHSRRPICCFPQSPDAPPRPGVSLTSLRAISPKPRMR